MTMQFPNAVMNPFLDDTFQSTYISLHTDDPGATGANEVSGGSYARQAETFAAASGGQISNAANIEYTNMPAATVTYFGVWDASSGGNFIGGGPLTAPLAISSGQDVRFEVGELIIRFATP
jgi:hypothetical protein